MTRGKPPPAEIKNDLTADQRAIIFALVRHQLGQGRDVVFAYVNTQIAPLNQITQTVASADDLDVGIFEQKGYLYIERYRDQPNPDKRIPLNTIRLKLLQDALNYYAWWTKPAWRRWLITQAAALSTEVRAAVISLITALVTSLITVLALQALGLS